MISELNPDFPYRNKLILWSVLAAIFAIGTVLLSHLFLPFYAAFLASVIFIEKKGKRFLSYFLAGLPVLLDVLVNRQFAVGAIGGVLVAFFLWLCYIKGFRKAETAFILTAFFAAVFFTAISLSLMSEAGEYTFGAAFSEVDRLFDESFAQMFASYEETASMLGETAILIGEEEKALLASELKAILPSILVVFAFVAAGVTLKVFRPLVTKASRISVYPKNWRFITSNLFAYVFMILGCTMIFANPVTAFGVTVWNLFVILAAVYGYIGTKYSLYLIAKSKRKGLMIVLAVFAVIFLNVTLLLPLAVFGTIFTILGNRFAAMMSGGNDRPGPDEN